MIDNKIFKFPNDFLVDFDARTGHNHGTKFRFRKNKLIDLYENVEEI